MFEDRPILKERLMAGGVFAGIAIAAVAGFELVVTGGLDLPTPGAAPARAERADYIAVMDGPWRPDGVATASRFRTTAFADDVNFTEGGSSEELAGGMNDASAPDGDGRDATRSEADLYRDIEYLDADTSTYEAPLYAEADDDLTPSGEADESDALSDDEREKLNASGSASPW